MPWPVLLCILILLAGLIAVLMTLKMTAHARILLDRQFSVQLHIKLYRIHIKTLQFDIFDRKKASQKPSKKKGRIPDLKFIDTQLSVYSAVGLMDAKHTALAVGGLYSLLGAVSGAVGHFTNLKKCSLQVQPVYAGNRFYIEVNCIAQAKVGNSIIAYIRYLVSKKF